MTAGHDLVLRHIERACGAAIDGRRAARALAEWTRQHSLNEPEFQLLWSLRAGPANGRDQTMLARELAFSPALVSAAIERLRERGWVTQQNSGGDRRRRLWRLSAAGQSLLDQMVQLAIDLRFEPHHREAAA